MKAVLDAMFVGHYLVLESNYFIILRRASTQCLMMILSSVREQLFHHCKGGINAMFVDDIV